MPSSALSAGATAVASATLSYLFSSMHTLRSEQHKNLVDRVSQQLKSLYGPLLACVTASKSAYEAMVHQLDSSEAPARTVAEFKRAVREDPHGPAAAAYRAWVKQVLLPLSQRAADLVIERADLLEGDAIEPLLLQLVAHVSAYKVILKSWEEGAVHEASQVAYPEGLHEWISTQVTRLKRRQGMLLGLDQHGGYTSLGGGLMRLVAKL